MRASSPLLRCFRSLGTGGSYCGAARNVTTNVAPHAPSRSFEDIPTPRITERRIPRLPEVFKLAIFGSSSSDCPRVIGTTADQSFVSSGKSSLPVYHGKGFLCSRPRNDTALDSGPSQPHNLWVASGLLQYQSFRTYLGLPSAWPSSLGCRIAGQHGQWFSTASSAPDYYSLLGITKTASQDEIKKAYRQTALKWHPDRNPQNREEAGRRFREASEAYQTLSDARRRAQYDASLDADAFRPGDSRSEYNDPMASRMRGDTGGVRFGNLTPEEAELLFRRAFGGVSLDEILRQALNIHGGLGWGAGAPYQRHDLFKHRMGSRPSTSFLDDHEIYEILKDFSSNVVTLQ